MSMRKCKRLSCPRRFMEAASTNEAQKYGYCSWDCLEADDPELAERIRKQNEAAQKAVIAILVAIATAIFFVVKWLLLKRKEDPPLFKKVMMWSGAVCAVFLVLTLLGSGDAFSASIESIAVRQCHAVELEFMQRNSVLEAQGDRLAEDGAALEKAGVKCPAGGTYLIEDGQLVCSKHGKP